MEEGAAATAHVGDDVPDGPGHCDLRVCKEATEVVEEERTGLLAPPHDAAGFADSIEHLAQDGRLREEMGHRAVERVRRNFTVDRDVEKTLDMYALLEG